MKINKHPIMGDIEALLQSKVTAYKIQQETGINRSTIGRLKNGEIEIKKLSLENALKLQAFYEDHKNDIKPSQA